MDFAVKFSQNPTKLNVGMKIGNKTVVVSNDHRELEHRDDSDQHTIPSITGLEEALDSKQGKSTLEEDIEKAGFTKNDGTYTKPESGIPKSDLEDNVQESLKKADSALQKHQDLTGYAKKTDIPTVPTKVSEFENDSGYLTTHQDISGKQDKSALETDVETLGFTKNTGTYSKPSGGIPKTDLASDVQTSLSKADSALQKHQSLTAYRLISNSYSKDEINTLLASAGKVKTVNNIEPDKNGNIEIKGGTGQDGTTFTPSVSSDGTLSWTNDGGKDNPTPVNIKGESVTVTSVSESTEDGGSNVVTFSDGKTLTVKNGRKGNSGGGSGGGSSGSLIVTDTDTETTYTLTLKLTNGKPVIEYE